MNLFRRYRRVAPLGCCLIAIGLLTGCQQSASRSTPVSAALQTSQTSAKEAASSEPKAAQPGDDKVELLEENWELQKLGGQRIGHSHTWVEKVADGDQTLIRTTSISESQLQRLGQVIQQKIKLVSWSRESGEFLRFESLISGAGGDSQSSGTVKGKSLTITQNTAGKRTSQQILWRPEWGGLFAAEESLRKSPPQPGETRVITALLPILNQPGEIHISAADKREGESGETSLLKLKVAMFLLGGKEPVLEALQWVDAKGEMQRSLIEGVDQETTRVSQEEALGGEGGTPVDVILTTTIRLKEPLEKPHSAKRIVYQAHVRSGEIGKVFVEGQSQRVRNLDESTAEVEVLALRPDSLLSKDLPPDPPTEADRSANNLIQSDDRAVIALAQEGAGDERDPWKLAMRLERYVHQKVTTKNFSQAMATAAEVAHSLEGDCTEHAVLLAALLRARDVPSRVAIGLVYFPPQQGFAYHMWTEAWIGDRWIPLDATLGLGGIGGGHLKLAQSNLADSYAALLRVMQAMGRLELEVKSVER